MCVKSAVRGCFFLSFFPSLFCYVIIFLSFQTDCLFSSHGESRAKYNLTEPIPLQVKHVTVEFIVEPFRPSGPFPRTMKISAQ